jgi:hypothetical protein
MLSKTWIYDWDKHAFEHYAEGRTLEGIKAHTEHGEAIIHLDPQGLLWYVEGGEATVWEEDSVVEVDGATWNLNAFIQLF